MAETFRTSEIAALIGVHPNTVRLYEELELIPKPERLPNGYRVYGLPSAAASSGQTGF